MTVPETQGSVQIIARDKDRYVRYKTEGQPLGAGSGGTVWLATRLPDTVDASADESRRVAIKVATTLIWKGKLAAEAVFLNSLQGREAALVALTGGLFRPVRINTGPEPLEVEDAYKSSLIELEYLDGPTLKRWMEDTWRRDPAPAPAEIVEETLRLARQLAEALVQIQDGPEVALIHRDIKPDNIMRTSRGIRLFDFNVARPDDGAEYTEHIGTHGYMAPEVLTGADYDTRADLFSVGVVLWEVALRRRFDLYVHTEKRNDCLYLRWPVGAAESWPEAERDCVRELLECLVVERSLRLRNARDLLKLVDALIERRRPAEPVDPFEGLDMIELLAELRPSALAAVVTDTQGAVSNQARQDALKSRMLVADPLEDWLTQELREAAHARRSGPALYVLAGNAGDGKSHLLQQVVRKRLGRELDARLRVIADATHAARPDSTQHERLAEFFAPFADNPEGPPSDLVHVIAMNTGMVIRFFEGKDGARFTGLYRALQAQLGLRRIEPDEAAPRWPLQVINLDLRDLLAVGANGDRSFAERMLDRLDPHDPTSLVAGRWAQCEACPAFSLCPVAFNLRALRMPTPRRAVLHALRRVALDNDVHTSPRNLWGFLYRLTTGGVERYDAPDRGGGTPCDLVRKRADARDEGAWLLAGQFTELLFQQPDAGAPWSGLARHDPAFCGAPALDTLHTRISVKTELDNDPELVAELGGTAKNLAGLALDTLLSKLPQTGFKGRRRDAAIRRHAMFHADTLDAWARHDGAEDYLPLLRAYDAFSRDAPLDAAAKASLKDLRDLVQAVFLHGHGREVDGQPYLRVSQPNARARNMLLVKVDHATLTPIFGVQKIVTKDAHILAHKRRERILAMLGYRPNQVTLDIRGVRLTVDLALYEFLRRVGEGQRPSKKAMSQFQALAFVGERVGNHLAAEAEELFVWEEAKGCLHRLGTDDFGHTQLTLPR